MSCLIVVLLIPLSPTISPNNSTPTVQPVDKIIEVYNPLGSRTKCIRCVKNLDIEIAGQHLPTDAILIDMIQYDIILGMNWLAQNNAKILCREGRVILSRPGLPKMEYRLSKPVPQKRLISALKVQKYLRKGCVAFLLSLSVKKSNDQPLESLEVVREFPDVFPERIARTSAHFVRLNLEFNPYLEQRRYPRPLSVWHQLSSVS